MMKYLAGVLSVIAVGVLLIAYGLLAPRASATLGGFGQYGMSVADPYLTQRLGLYGARAGALGGAYAVPFSQYTTVPGEAAGVRGVRPVQTIVASPVRSRTIVRAAERSPRRDWRRTALVVGGSSATGAGVGAIFGGKKGALIGAAIGGGASALYETTRK